MTTPPTTPRDAALAYHARGFAPLPLPPRAKRPALPDWPNYRFDPAAADAAFPPGRPANVGVLCGAPSGGLVDVDLDCPGARAAAPLLLPPTGMVSGRASAPGSHYWFVVDTPPDRAAENFDDPTDPDDGHLLELRGTGGQTVVPPSVYGEKVDKKSGEVRPPEPCVWDRDGAPARVPIADLRAAVKRVAAAALLARHWTTRRNALACGVAGGLLRAGWPVGQVEAFMAAVCAAADDEETDNRVGTVAHTARNLTDGGNVTGWPTVAKTIGVRGEAVVARVRDWLGVKIVAAGQAGNPPGAAAPGGDDDDTWPESIPLGRPPETSPFPLDVLPPWLARWAAAVSEEKQVAPDLPALLGLGLLGGGLGRKVVVRPRKGFTEPVNLYVMPVLPPGERKSQTFMEAIAPVQALERELREAARPVVAEAESEFRIAEARVKGLEAKVAKADEPAERDRLREELKDARAELLALEVPPVPLLYTEDDTPDALKAEVIKQGGRLMVASTEAKCLENITLYSEKPNFDVYLKGHAGDELKTGRVSRGRQSVHDPALTCLLSPQPAVLEGLAANRAMRGRGFLARWAYGLPVSRIGFRRIAAPAAPDEVKAEYARLMTAVWKTDYGRDDETNEPAAAVLPFDQDAAAAFRAFEGWVEPHLADGGRLAAMAGWGNKLCGLCARLAALFHVGDAVGDGRSWDGAVGEGAVARAVRVCKEYLIPHARAVYDLMGVNEKVEAARLIWKWVARNALGKFSKRDCYRALRSHFDTVDQLQPGLDLLERHYLIRGVGAGGKPRRGRKASPVYEVNPDAGGDDHGRHPTTPPPAPNHCNSVQDSGGASRKSGDRPAPQNAEPSPENLDTNDRTDPVGDWGVSPREDHPRTVDTNDRTPAGPAGVSPNNGNSVRDSGGTSENSAGAEFTLVTSAAGVGAVVAAIEDDGGPVGVDTETTGLDPRADRVRLLQVATARGTFLIDLFALPDLAGDLAELFGVLARVEVVGHHLQFDLGFLSGLGFATGRVYDTMLASQVLHAGERGANNAPLKHGLKDVAARELGRALDKGGQTSDWSKPLTPAQLAYAAADAAVLLPLAGALKEKLAAAGLDRAAGVEMAALPCVAWLAAAGVGFDRGPWEALAAEAEARAETLREQLDAAAPDPATLYGTRNWNSPDQVGEAFAALGVPLDATDDDALAGVDHPLAALVREYRAAAKRAGTYGRGWAADHAAGGRVYAAWRQIGAERTGRMSCRGPNLQNLPRDPRYRACFVARPGHLLVKADYSQIELRVAAKVSGDGRMLEVYRAGRDIHTLTAAMVLGKPEADVTKADRQLAKAVNFGLLYGQGAKGLRAYARSGYGVSITLEEAETYRGKFFAAYPGLRRWHRSIQDGPQDTRTLTGRRRLGVEAYTQKLNTPVQGTGGDGLKAGLALLWERRAACPTAVPVLVVHDEVVVEVPGADAAAAAAWLERGLREGMEPLVAPVPVVVDVTAGRTWGGSA